MRWLPLIFYPGLILSSLVLGDTLVFKNGSRTEVQDLQIGTETLTYSIKGMKATVPVRYIDLEATRQANAELEAKRLEAAAAALERSRQEESRPIRVGAVSSPLGDLARKRFSDKEIQELIEKWKKRPAKITHVSGPGQPPVPADPQDANFQIPFTRAAGVMFVTGTLNHAETARFVFDTGASVTTLTMPTARAAGLVLNPEDTVELSTANGPTIGYVTTLQSLTLGNLEVEELRVIVTENCTENLLGGNLISQFLVTVDSRQNRIIMTHQPGRYR